MPTICQELEPALLLPLLAGAHIPASDQAFRSPCLAIVEPSKCDLQSAKNTSLPVAAFPARFLASLKLLLPRICQPPRKVSASGQTYRQATLFRRECWLP
jgi:hypothetical protein